MFTVQQRRVIVFLCSVLLLGVFLRVFNVHRPLSYKFYKEVSLKININTATLEELEKIPFIGETTARRIVSYRELKGKITSLKDLENIKGVGKKKLGIISKFIIF